MKQKKKFWLLWSSLALLFCMAGCSGKVTEDDVRVYVTGRLDALYKGTVSSQFMKLSKYDDAKVKADHEAKLEIEAEWLAEGYDVAILSESTKSKLIDMYQSIYAHSKYEVESVKEEEDGSFTVTLQIYPLDIIQQFLANDADQYVTEFNAKVNQGEYNTLTEEQYEDEWARGFIDLISARIDTIGYLDAETVTVTLAADEQGIYDLSEADLNVIDAYIITY